MLGIINKIYMFPGYIELMRMAVCAITLLYRLYTIIISLLIPSAL